MAAEKGHLQVVQKLLQAGANVNHQNKVMTIYSSFMYVLLSRCSKPTIIHVYVHVPVMLNTDSACMMGLIA